jgi:hypothetical protein
MCLVYLVCTSPAYVWPTGAFTAPGRFWRQITVLLLDVSSLQEPVLLLDVFSVQLPVLIIDATSL